MKTNNESSIIFHSGIEQRSAEWHALRLGKITASEVHKICGAKFGETGDTYIDDIVSEYLTGKAAEIPDNEYLRHGREFEPVARQLFAKATETELHEVTFIENKLFELCGASPDAICFDKKFGVEIKCPAKQSNHKKLLDCINQNDLKRTKKEYYWQCMFSILISGFDTWKFISYHPDFNNIKDLRLYTINIHYNQSEIDFLTDRIYEAQIKIARSLESYGIDINQITN